MSHDDATETVAWSRRRWAGLIGGIFLAQIAAVLVLTAPRQNHSTSTAAPPRAARWLTAPAQTRQLLAASLDTDPTLLASASARGFSGAAWLKPAALPFRTSEAADAERPPAPAERPLTRPVSPAGHDANALLDPARKPFAEPPLPAIPQAALRTASGLRVTGPLASRALLAAPALPPWPHTDLLADTRVHVLVNPDGAVFSRRLAPSPARTPAQQAADQRALELVQQLRFARLPASQTPNAETFTEGTLVFQWLAVTPAAP